MRKVSRERGLRRLLHLANKLDRLPAQRFYYGKWVGDGWQGRPDLSCGTTGCALGWAATVRSWGLRLRRYGSGAYVGLKGREYSPIYSPNTTSLNSAEVAFGITHDEAYRLFIPGLDADALGPDATAGMVAAHIRRFVAEAGAAA